MTRPAGHEFAGMMSGESPEPAPPAESAAGAGDFRNFYWRAGGQVGRTLYVDHQEGEKDPRLLFGLVDTQELAAHIVKIHNWWLDLSIEGERAWGQLKAGHPDGKAAG